MHTFESGFLSEPFDDVRANVRSTYEAFHSLLHHVNRESVELQHSIEIHTENNREVYAATLFARTLSSSQATVVLLEHGLVPQARTVLRSGLETLFALIAIAEKPELVKRLIDSHGAEQRRAAKNITLWKHPDLKAIAETQNAKESFQMLLTSPESKISTFELAEAAGLEDWYRSIYMTLSWSAHGATIDLDRHIVQNEDGQMIEFRNEPEISNQEVDWVVAIDIQIKATYALALIFNSVDIASATLHEANLHKIAENFQLTA